MLIRRRRLDDDIAPSEITDPRLYHGRRRFLRGGAALALGLGAPGLLLPARHALGAARFADAPQSEFNTDEELTPHEAVTTYNNFYEFSTDKREPSRLAQDFESRPWSLSVEGEVANPQLYDVDELIRMSPVEDRIYRLRCVEAWSMVIPWVAIPLAPLIRKWEPTSRARYVKFTTLFDPEQMPGQRPGFFGSVLEWPYTEGLRIDEAMNPLTVLGVGLYGEILPNQNGAPIRLIVPWKYGFKSIKSIVSISFTEEQPATAWNKEAPNEYGFYANVNPNVDHPRWSQAKERRIGEFFKRDTLMFNGYGDHVAHLYDDMDLTRYY